MLVSLLVFVWYFVRLHMQPAKPKTQQNNVFAMSSHYFTMKLHAFTLQTHMILDDAQKRFQDLFRQWFVMSLGIDISFVLVRLWHRISYSSTIVFRWCCWIVFITSLIRNLPPQYTKKQWWTDCFFMTCSPHAHVPQSVFLKIPWLMFVAFGLDLGSCWGPLGSMLG